MSNKLIPSISLLFLTFFSFAQDVELSQAEKNRIKAEELKSRLDSINTDSVSIVSYSESERVNQIESKIDSLDNKVDELLKINQQLVLALSEFKKTSNSTDNSKNNTISSGQFSNTYFLVLESQTNLIRAKEAYDKFTAKFGVALQIVQNKSSKWYYLVLQNSVDYTTAKNLQAVYKSKSIEDAWVIASQKVITIQ